MFRARVIFLAAEGGSIRSIARTLETVRVSGRRGRFARECLAGLNNNLHPGAGRSTGARLIADFFRPNLTLDTRVVGRLVVETAPWTAMEDREVVSSKP